MKNAKIFKTGCIHIPTLDDGGVHEAKNAQGQRSRQQLKGMHDRWRSQLRRSKTTGAGSTDMVENEWSYLTHRKQLRYARSTNMGENERGYLTHRKLLSLVQVHHQNSR